MELLFWCPTWTLWKREGKYICHTVHRLDYLLPSGNLWPCCDYCVPLSTWLVSWSCTVAQQVGAWFTLVEYKGPWTLQGNAATFIIWWRENASPNVSHWRRCISACGSQSLGIITEDGTWCCPWSILQDLFGQYKGQKAKDKPEYNTAFMSKPRGYYNAQTLPTLWKKGRAECVSISHILPQKSEDAREWGMSRLDCV